VTPAHDDLHTEDDELVARLLQEHQVHHDPQQNAAHQLQVHDQRDRDQNLHHVVQEAQHATVAAIATTTAVAVLTKLQPLLTDSISLTKSHR
jgi:hypothetical protein